MKHLAIDRQPTADAAAKRNIKNRILPNSDSGTRLAQSRHIRIIINIHRHTTRLVSQPLAQRKIIPADDLMRATGSSGLTIKWPTETNAD